MSIVPFHTPTTFLLAGPSQCGKSTWIRQLIESKDVMFTQPPKKVIYAYSAWQPMFEEMKGVEFLKGLPTYEEMESWSDLLLVLDDVMQAACLSEEVLSLFCVQSHHRNITAAILMQNLFPPGRFGRTISLNSLPHQERQVASTSTQSADVPRTIPGQFKLKVGDCVRISHLRRAFLREYNERYTGELFKVKTRKRGSQHLHAERFPRRRRGGHILRTGTPVGKRGSHWCLQNREDTS